ncbi:MAG: hypothetical protein ABIS51_13855 [Sphingomonas sp.]
MKFWQLGSILRADEWSLIGEVAETRADWAFLQEWASNWTSLVNTQDRSKLDAELPVEFVREMLSLSQVTLFLAHDGWLRSYQLSGSDLSISALSAFNRFGGTAIENALEYGSIDIGSA